MREFVRSTYSVSLGKVSGVELQLAILVLGEGIGSRLEAIYTATLISFIILKENARITTYAQGQWISKRST